MYATSLLAKLMLANLDSAASCMDETTFLFPCPASPEMLYIEELWLKLVRMIGSSRNLFALFWMELVY